MVMASIFSFFILVLAIALVIAGIEVADEGAFDNGAHGRPAARNPQLLRQNEGKAANALCLQRAHGGAGQLAQIGSGKVLGLAAADEQQAFCFQSGGVMQKRGFESLAGDFAAGDNFFGGVANGCVGALD